MINRLRMIFYLKKLRKFGMNSLLAKIQGKKMKSLQLNNKIKLITHLNKIKLKKKFQAIHQF
jgi:hypothetical protein